jgi:hypothetical protein
MISTSLKSVALSEYVKATIVLLFARLDDLYIQDQLRTLFPTAAIHLLF